MKDVTFFELEENFRKKVKKAHRFVGYPDLAKWLYNGRHWVASKNGDRQWKRIIPANMTISGKQEELTWEWSSAEQFVAWLRGDAYPDYWIIPGTRV